MAPQHPISVPSQALSELLAAAAEILESGRGTEEVRHRLELAIEDVKFEMVK